MQILDTTLREGEQTRGVSFTFEQKKQIVETLDSFGVDIIELGHPVVSPNIKKAVKNLAKLKLHAETMAHARANLKDIDEAVDCGVDWVGIFISTSNIGIKTKYNYSKEQILEKITESVEYAKSRGLKVRYTPEDGTRTERDYLLQAIHAGKKADRISIVDTVGTMTPSKFHELVKFVIKKSGKDLNVHCHNDFGLATANSLAAFEAGAKLSDVTINGLGERVGITPLSELTMALSQLHGVKKDWDFKLLPKLSKMVEKFSGQTIAANTPIVGENAFSHKAGLHTRAVLNDPSSYEAINPAILGMERTIVVDQFAGKDALKNRLEKIGLNLDEKELDRVLTDLKNSPKKWISDADLIEFSQNDFKQQEFSTIHHSSINAFVSITLDEKVFVPSISKKIIALPNVKKVYEVTGSQDIFALMEASDVINLNDFIDKISSIEGVSKTSSKIILREHHATNTN